MVSCWQALMSLTYTLQNMPVLQPGSSHVALIGEPLLQPLRRMPLP